MIVRTEHTNNFLVANKSFFDDPRLDTTQRGLLATMLTFPDQWVFYLKPLEEKTGMSREVLKRHLKVLESAGYVLQRSTKINHSDYDLIVYEVSTVPYTGEVERVNIINNNINTNSINHESNKDLSNHLSVNNQLTESDNNKPEDEKKEKRKHSRALDRLIEECHREIAKHPAPVQTDEKIGGLKLNGPGDREKVIAEYKRMKKRGEVDMKTLELMLLATN